MSKDFFESFKTKCKVLNSKNENDKSFYEGGKTAINDIIKQLHILVGAMILDGYDEYDSCIKFMNDFISETEQNIKEENIFN